VTKGTLRKRGEKQWEIMYIMIQIAVYAGNGWGYFFVGCSYIFKEE